MNVSKAYPGMCLLLLLFLDKICRQASPVYCPSADSKQSQASAAGNVGGIERVEPPLLKQISCAREANRLLNRSSLCEHLCGVHGVAAPADPHHALRPDALGA